MKLCSSLQEAALFIPNGREDIEAGPSVDPSVDPVADREITEALEDIEDIDAPAGGGSPARP